MRILLVADEEAPYLWDYYQPGRLDGIDCVLSCGDLKQEYLEFLVTMSNKPLYYVCGNHDKGYVHFPPEGCECVEDQLVNIGGLRVLGLGGCIRYNPGPFQFTDQEMEKRVRKARRKIKKAGGVDIVITHAPPKGVGDAPDNAHRGFAAFLPLMDEFHPRYLIHGHVHQSYGNGHPRAIQYGETTVLNAVGWQILEIDAPARPRKKGLSQWTERLKKAINR
ncbi:MAG: metallophosphoesterase family protein [Clostridia bacterium]|nr:metallophosphoesterase family protein [Clostridia bacterium]